MQNVGFLTLVLKCNNLREESTFLFCFGLLVSSFFFIRGYFFFLCVLEKFANFIVALPGSTINFFDCSSKTVYMNQEASLL